MEYNYILHLGKTKSIKEKGRTTYGRQTINEPTSVGQSADRRRLLKHLTILKDNLVNLFKTTVLHFPSDTNRLLFVKLNNIDIRVSFCRVYYLDTNERKPSKNLITTSVRNINRVSTLTHSHFLTC